MQLDAANGPTTPDADEVMEQRRGEIFVVPDILCNAGGVVVSYFEWVQDLQQFFWDESEVMEKLYHVMDRAFAQVMRRVEHDGVSHRTAALTDRSPVGNSYHVGIDEPTAKLLQQIAWDTVQDYYAK